MNVIDYIDKYGDYSFKKKPLNEIDKLIFGLLSYVHYDGTVSYNSKDKRTVKQVAREFFKKNSKSDIRKNITAVRGSIKILNAIQDKKRYKDLFLYNDIYITDEEQQFSALCIEIEPKLVYVSFEGTDQQISGWEEDGKMIYKFPVKAQKQAIKYLNKHFTFKNCKIIVGGHSKGGNLALVSAMYSNFLVRRKIVQIYSYDGPGLRRKQIISKRYKKAEDKLRHIIPNYSIVGLLLRHTNNYMVVKSRKMGIMAHDAQSWQVDGDDFVKVKLSMSSKVLDHGILTWLDNYNEQERKEFVKELFQIFKKHNVTSLLQFVEEPRLLIKLMKDTSNMDPIIKEMIKELVEILKEYSKQAVVTTISKSLGVKNPEMLKLR